MTHQDVTSRQTSFNERLAIGTASFGFTMNAINAPEAEELIRKTYRKGFGLESP